MMDKLAAASLQEIVADPQLLDFARAQGRAAFADNCAPCHGAGGGGAKGYPNLNDDDWLWGGKLDDIAQTIRHGVRSADDKTRHGQHAGLRPRRHAQARPRSTTVADYVRSLVRPAGRARAPISRAGKKVFADNCAVCHGDGRQGQARARRAEPDRRDLALRLRQGGDRRRPRGTAAAA